MGGDKSGWEGTGVREGEEAGGAWGRVEVVTEVGNGVGGREERVGSGVGDHGEEGRLGGIVGERWKGGKMKRKCAGERRGGERGRNGDRARMETSAIHTNFLDHICEAPLRLRPLTKLLVYVFPLWKAACNIRYSGISGSLPIREMPAEVRSHPVGAPRTRPNAGP